MVHSPQLQFRDIILPQLMSSWWHFLFIFVAGTGKKNIVYVLYVLEL
jgi:hypothetical protein